MKPTMKMALEKAQKLQRKLVNEYGYWCDIIQDPGSRYFDVSYAGGVTRFEYETVFFVDVYSSIKG
jgi:hypothetical protein